MQSKTRRHVRLSGRPLKLASAPEACRASCSCCPDAELPLPFLRSYRPSLQLHNDWTTWLDMNHNSSVCMPRLSTKTVTRTGSIRGRNLQFHCAQDQRGASRTHISCPSELDFIKHVCRRTHPIAAGSLWLEEVEPSAAGCAAKGAIRIPCCDGLLCAIAHPGPQPGSFQDCTSSCSKILKRELI